MKITKLKLQICMFEEKRNNGLKNDLAEDKLRWDLMPIEEIEELVDILTSS